MRRTTVYYVQILRITEHKKSSEKSSVLNCPNNLEQTRVCFREILSVPGSNSFSNRPEILLGDQSIPDPVMTTQSECDTMALIMTLPLRKIITTHLSMTYSS